jgi:hypothetical protein
MPAPTRVDVAFGHYIVVPRGYHLTLASVLTLMGLLVLIPSWIFFKKSITFMVGYVSLPLAVALGMWLQGVFRNQKKLWDPTTNTNWLFIDIGTDRLVGVVAIVGAILIAAQSGILTAGLVNCQSWTAQSLAMLVFGPDLTNCTAVTDWTAQYRVPEFATQILTYQMCLDDYALTIAYVVIGFATMVVMVLVAVEQMMARDQSLRLYTRLDLYKKQAAQELVEEETDDTDDRPNTMASMWPLSPTLTRAMPLTQVVRDTGRGVKNTPTRLVHELRPF